MLLRWWNVIKRYGSNEGREYYRAASTVSQLARNGNAMQLGSVPPFSQMKGNDDDSDPSLTFTVTDGFQAVAEKLAEGFLESSSK